MFRLVDIIVPDNKLLTKSVTMDGHERLDDFKQPFYDFLILI